MSLYCTACGAKLRCGRVVSQTKRSANGAKDYPQEYPRKRKRSSGQGRVHSDERPRRERNEADYYDDYDDAQPCVAEVGAGKDRRKSGTGRKTVFFMLKLLTALLIVYLLLSLLQIMRVRLSSYEFDTQMKMTCDNFGEALDGYIDGGKWSYNTFSFTAEYSGTHNGEDFSVAFSVKWNVRVKYIEKDGDPVIDEKLLNAELMAMFI